MLHCERTKDADLIGLTSRWDDAGTVLRCRQPAGPSKTSVAKIGQDCYKMYFSMRRGIRWIKMEWLQPDDWKTLKDLVLMTSPARSPKSNGRFRDDLSQESGRPDLHCHEPNLLNLIRWRNAPTDSAETSNARTSTRFHKSSEKHSRHARMRWDFIDRLRSTVMQRRSKAPWSSTSTAICPANDAKTRTFKILQGISVPAIMKPMRIKRDCPFLKMLVVQLDFEIGQFYLNKTINTLDFVPGLLAIYRD